MISVQTEGAEKYPRIWNRPRCSTLHVRGYQGNRETNRETNTKVHFKKFQGDSDIFPDENKILNVQSNF
ncbi:hypothetical protein V1478_003332 [Vespula squamosa]|uniref:Uncharacterized protein n=1 Tax=Vespula squamosa TaxID=30214 RepID=A0ABD2BPV0_VESSQ